MSFNEINSDNFQSEVLESDIPVLLDFYADWCKPCKIMNSVIDKISEEFGSTLKINKVDAEKNYEIISKYKISSLPTLLIFNKGELKKSSIGLRTVNDIKKDINEAIKEAVII